MSDEELYFHFIDEVFDNDLVLLEMLQCHHYASLSVEGRVDLAVLTLTQLLVY
jgi:hypothetical protein